jgi:hypothetical protein
MLRYQAAALAFKAFSANSLTRSTYRALGNLRNRNRVTDFSGGYVERGAWLQKHLSSFGLLADPNIRGLEIGTGWMHFYGLVAAVSGVEHVDLYDVWDNRQFNRCRRSFASFEQHFDELGIPADRQETAAEKIARLRRAGSFDRLYEALGLRYVLDSEGKLRPLQTEAYDFVCSLDVLEHVPYESLAGYIKDLFRVLKPGAYSMHQVGIDDHLTHNDKTASQKQYMKYGDTEWKLRFANGVQYFNRATHDEICRWFKDAGFEEISIETERGQATVDQLGGRDRLAERFRDQTDESLYAVRSFIVHRKPVQ